MIVTAGARPPATAGTGEETSGMVGAQLGAGARPASKPERSAPTCTAGQGKRWRRRPGLRHRRGHIQVTHPAAA